MKKFTDHLQYSFWIYIVIAVMATVVWTTVFHSLEEPGNEEKVSVLFIGSGLESAGLESELSDKIELLTEQQIRQVRVEEADIVNHEMLVMFLSTRVYDTDLFILSENMLSEGFCKTFFPAIPKEKLQRISNNAQYYVEDEVPYGILIGGGDTRNKFTDFYTGAEKYYVFFSKQSVNLGNIFSEENQNDAALAILKYLLE